MPTEERLSTVSPDELHRFLLKAYRIGNRARHKFARALLAMYRSRFYASLGYSTIAHYAEKHFFYHHF